MVKQKSTTDQRALLQEVLPKVSAVQAGRAPTPRNVSIQMAALVSRVNASRKFGKEMEYARNL
jgi:hypothetical protein